MWIKATALAIFKAVGIKKYKIREFSDFIVVQSLDRYGDGLELRINGAVKPRVQVVIVKYKTEGDEKTATTTGNTFLVPRKAIEMTKNYPKTGKFGTGSIYARQ